MSRASLTLSLCVSLGLGLTACGDDSSPGAGETDTDASSSGEPTTSTPTTDDLTTGPGSSTTDEGTTTTGPDPDTGSETTDPGETEGETTGPVTPEDTYFRINSLQLRDPHAIAPIVGDQTQSINGDLTTAVTTDEDEDGFLDLGFVFALLPQDQSDGSSEAMFFANALCTAPQETASCSIIPKTDPVEGLYSGQEAGECYAPDDANLSTYPDPPEAPSPTTGPCFSAELGSVTIAAGDFDLPLENTVVSARYVGNPATNLIEGNIEGFMSEETADSVLLEQFGNQPLSVALRDEDMDMNGEGWVFHIAFTAVPVEWTER